MKIPNNWYRLKRGTPIQAGDKYWSRVDGWNNSGGPSNGHVGDSTRVKIYIRRLKPRKKH